MPLNEKKFGASCFLILSFALAVLAQAPPQQAATTTAATASAPSAAEVMRDRINKVKAMIALKSYSAAIYELEGIRRETNDTSVTSVVQVMLMNCYLEQADYKRAQTLLTELFNAQKANKPNANYYAVAAQVIKGARSQHERYKSLGLIVSDPNLPATAVTDLDKMRETVETVVEQAKLLGANKKDAPAAMALLEEASNTRGSLARDDYDSKRWKEEVADARENLMNSRSIINAVDDSSVAGGATPPSTGTLASNTGGAPKAGETNAVSSAAMIPVSNPPAAIVNPTTGSGAASDSQIAKTIETAKNDAVNQNAPTPNAGNADSANTLPSSQPVRSRRVAAVAANTPNNSTETAAANNPQASIEAPAAAKNNDPMQVGSLVEYATDKVSPTYPPAARTVRVTGVVRVEVMVDEDGKVSVENTSGPAMLQRAALDAVKRWKFKPFTRDGQPVKAKGFVNFNFNL